MANIKFINKVEFTQCKNLKGMFRINTKGVKVPNDILWKPVIIKPGASLTIASKSDDRNTIWTASLKFLTCEDISVNEKLCWRLTLVDGTKYLLGTDERPFATVSFTENIPDSVRENQLNEVSVGYSSTKNIPVIV